MAPPTTTRAKKRLAQRSRPGLSTTFARVSKNSVVSKSEKEKNVAAKQLAIEKLQHAEQKPRSTPAPTPTKTKRKRAESESEDEGKEIIAHFSSSKRSKTQLPTPPRSTPERAISEPVVPAPVQELVQIHKVFLKAFSLHRAHNGPSAPAELGQLLESVTRLYQKRVISAVDVQRMFGVLEMRTELAPRSSVPHEKSPFKLMVSGLGANRRCVVEFLGYETQTRRNGRTVMVRVSDFNEQNLQTHYELHIGRIYSNPQLSGMVDAYPVLEFATGAQTVARQKKAYEAKKLILDGRKPDLDFGRLSVKDDTEAESAKQQTVKSRTLSLFDRVKAKQLANAAVNVPSADTLRRKHAVGRIGEVVEILRMKQQQKLRGRGASGKASFAVQQIISEIRVSLGIPMADDEIKMCLEILAKEVTGGWCSIFELGQTRSVVLTGMGRSGVEIAAMVKA